MMRATLAFILCVTGTAEATSLALKRRFEHSLDGTGWSVYAHGRDLVALNRKSLKVETIDAFTGDVKNRDDLDSHGAAPRLLETLSSAKGEFLVALGRDNNVVELHALDNNVSWQVRAKSSPLSIALIEGKNEEVFLVIATRFDTTVYHRTGARLETVRTINTKIGNKQVQITRSIAGLIVLSILDRQNTVHGVQLDTEGGPHEHVTLGRPMVTGTNATVDTRTNDYLAALTTNRELRFYVEGEADDSDAYPMDPRILSGQWFKGDSDRAMFAAAHRQSDGNTELALYNPYLLTDTVKIPAGRVQTISEVGSFNDNKKTYYYFVKDHHVIALHAEDEDASITFKDNERVQSVQLMRPSKGLAVMVEGPKSTRLQLIVSSPTPLLKAER